MAAQIRKKFFLILIIVVGTFASRTLCGIFGVQNKDSIFTPGFNFKYGMLSALVWALVYGAIFILITAVRSSSKTPDSSEGPNSSS